MSNYSYSTKYKALSTIMRMNCFYNDVCFLFRLCIPIYPCYCMITNLSTPDEWQTSENHHILQSALGNNRFFIYRIQKTFLSSLHPFFDLQISSKKTHTTEKHMPEKLLTCLTYNKIHRSCYHIPYQTKAIW